MDTILEMIQMIVDDELNEEETKKVIAHILDSEVVEFLFGRETIKLWKTWIAELESDRKKWKITMIEFNIMLKAEGEEKSKIEAKEKFKAEAEAMSKAEIEAKEKADEEAQHRKPILK